MRSRHSPFRSGLALLAMTAVLIGCAGPKPRPTTPVPGPAEPTPGGPGQPSSITVNGFEQKVIVATNAFREENKLAALKPTVQLIVIAQNHARNMARQDKFGDSDKNGHILDGKSFEDRIQVSGYQFARVAENVGYELNRTDPVASVMQAWKNSPGHRKNMLIPDVTQIGVGAQQGRSGRWYFVQVFGHPEAPAKQAAIESAEASQ